MISRASLHRRLFMSGLIVAGMAAVAIVMPARQASAATVIQNIATSSSGSMQTRWYSLRGYGAMPKWDVDWPLRSDGCSPGSTAYKISPWQPAYGFIYNGNTMNLSSPCIDRYSDAGTTANGGAWIHANAQGGWAMPGAPQTVNWQRGGYRSWSNVMAGCGSLPGGGAASIWGQPGPDTSDQMYSSGVIGTVPGFALGLYYDQYPRGSAQATKLYSNGVTLIRDSFNLSATDLTRIGQGSTKLLLQAYADDWLRVYINGVALNAYSTSTAGEVQLDLTAYKNLLVSGTNWLGVMVADKGVFDTVDPGGRAAGVCYNLQYQYNQLPSYNLQPGVGATIYENGSPTSNPYAQVGDQIRYTYTVFNNSAGPTVGPANCTIYANEYSGSHSKQSPADTGPIDGPETAAMQAQCNPIIGPFGTVTLTENVSVTGSDVNKTICRSLYVTPTTSSGGTASDEACVPVASLPYLRVFGGDISAGNGFTNTNNTCTSSNSAIISWNQRGQPFYPGAGAQYAAMALNSIIDFASAQGTVAAGANAPSDLSFANSSITSTDKAAGTFGRSFGTVPCTTDYYGTPPPTQPASTNVGAMTGPAYSSNTGLNGLSGAVATGQRTVVYVQGDVYISNNIVYANSGTWNYGNIPLFELIVKGNIYIGRNVRQLDGVYIAQPNGASGGTIYTCATGLGAPVDPTNPTFYSLCNTQLIVNGSFVSSQIRLLRTFGTLSSSTAGESATASSAGEVFNFNPTLWIAQPSSTPNGLSNSYNAITDLPPVL